jgi:hypothetical protein
MSDLPTIDQAFDEAVALTIKEESPEDDDSKEEAPEAESETKPEPEAEEVKEEEADKAEPEEEAFADKPDLSGKTPEELEEIYKNWQKSYTQTRQAEKAREKEMAEKLAKYEETLSQFKAQQPEKPINEMTTEELQQHFATKAQEIAKTAQENSYIESQEKSFYELDKRLDEDHPEHDPNLFYSVVGQVTKLRDQFEADKGTVVGFDFVGEAKKVISAYDEAVKQKVQSYLKRNNETARGKVSQSSKANPKVSSAKLKKAGGLDLDEAFEEALNETKGTFSF